MHNDLTPSPSPKERGAKFESLVFRTPSPSGRGRGGVKGEDVHARAQIQNALTPIFCHPERRRRAGMRGYSDFDSAQSDNSDRQKQNDLTPSPFPKLLRQSRERGAKFESLVFRTPSPSGRGRGGVKGEDVHARAQIQNDLTPLFVTLSEVERHG